MKKRKKMWSSISTILISSLSFKYLKSFSVTFFSSYIPFCFCFNPFNIDTENYPSFENLNSSCQYVRHFAESSPCFYSYPPAKVPRPLCPERSPYPDCQVPKTHCTVLHLLVTAGAPFLYLFIYIQLYLFYFIFIASTILCSGFPNQLPCKFPCLKQHTRTGFLHTIRQPQHNLQDDMRQTLETHRYTRKCKVKFVLFQSKN